MTRIHLDYNELNALFVETKEDPSLLHKRIERYDDEDAPFERHYVVLDNQKRRIIAMAATSLETNKDGSSTLHLCHVSVDPKYMGRGHARTLLRMVFADADMLGAGFSNDGFSSDLNRKNLGGCMRRIANDYPCMKFEPNRFD